MRIRRTAASAHYCRRRRRLQCNRDNRIDAAATAPPDNYSCVPLHRSATISHKPRPPILIQIAAGFSPRLTRYNLALRHQSGYRFGLKVRPPTDSADTILPDQRYPTHMLDRPPIAGTCRRVDGESRRANCTEMRCPVMKRYLCFIAALGMCLFASIAAAYAEVRADPLWVCRGTVHVIGRRASPSFEPPAGWGSFGSRTPLSI